MRRKSREGFQDLRRAGRAVLTGFGEAFVAAGPSQIVAAVPSDDVVTVTAGPAAPCFAETARVARRDFDAVLPASGSRGEAEDLFVFFGMGGEEHLRGNAPAGRRRSKQNDGDCKRANVWTFRRIGVLPCHRHPPTVGVTLTKLSEAWW